VPPAQQVRIRKKDRDDLVRERHPKSRRRCNDWIICAMPWPMHGANIGTTVRSCEAVGACMYVPHYPWVPQALHRGYTPVQVPDTHWVRPNAMDWLAKQADSGVRILGLELADEAIRFHDLPMAREKTILVLGHEQTGIPDEALDYIDMCVEIPMIGTGTTLNVACAATMVLYRLTGLD
jgi:tRNA (guanosine-2'-O-)-methyltransferase